MTNDIGQHLDQDSDTVKAIYDWHVAHREKTPRKYLGASILGHECERFLWFTFRLCCEETFEGRMLRLFETGQLEEARFVRELRGIGCEVHEVNEDGEQFGLSTMCGHVRGHIDGVAKGIPEAPETWHLVEMKTHNSKSFAKLKKDGNLDSKPMHTAQCQIYMLGMKLKRALYMARDKNTDELWTTRLKVDGPANLKLAEKAKRIVEASQPPPRLSNKCDDFRCRFCCAKELCFGTADVCLPLAYHSCRSCCHATPVMEGDNGDWKCEKYDCPIGEQGRLKGCADHLIIPGIIADVEVDTGGEDCIVFQAPGNTFFTCRNSSDAWTTAELMKTSREVVFSSAANEAKAIVGGKVVQEIKPK